jgi:signal transduction histidine kinase
MTDQVSRPEPYRLRGSRSAEDGAQFRVRRRAERLRQELAVRATVAFLILLFNELVGPGAGQAADRGVRISALLGIVLNGPYYLAARTGRWPWGQAYGRMLVDIVLVTGSLYAAGGLAAAPYLGIYAVVTVYAGTVLSSPACLVATWVATVGYLAVVGAQAAGWLPPTAAAIPPNAWSVALFNLLALNVVGVLTAMLARAYRFNQRRLGVLHEDLERAYDEASRLNAGMQRSARLQVLGELLTGVAHEIGNALQGALMSMELARRKVAGQADALRLLDQIEHGCATATTIVRNVLQTARQSSDEQVPVSMAEMTRRTLALKGYSLRRDGIAVQLDFSPDFPPVVGSPVRLQQVLLNLISNAQDAVRQGSRSRSIAIVGRSQLDRAVVEVRDTGPGIPADILPRLFDPFYTTKADGTGLGLTISAEIIRGLGGELTASNAASGGAVFRLSLPIATPGSAAPGESPVTGPRSV